MRRWRCPRYVLVVCWMCLASGGWASAGEDCSSRAATTSSCDTLADLGDAPESARRFLVDACLRGLMPPCGGSAGESFACPGEFVTREDMAVFLERLYHGSAFTPPSATGYFADVPATYCLAGWIEKLRADGITAGCATSPAQYCPFQAVTRWQMAVFLAKVILWRLEGIGAVMPVSGVIDGQFYNCVDGPGGVSLFADIVADKSLKCKAIHYIYGKAITCGCQGDNEPLRYCPDHLIPREQMAIFLVKASNCIGGNCHVCGFWSN